MPAHTEEAWWGREKEFHFQGKAGQDGRGKGGE